MNSPPVAPGPREVAQASADLAALQAKAGEARSELAGLLEEVAAAQSELAHSQAAQLVEANEHLVLGMMKAQADAEAASDELKQVSRSAELDVLTGLPNRSLMLDRLTRSMATAKRRGTKLALLFMAGRLSR